MNPVPPFLSAILLAAMMAAGVSHYWSLQEFIAEYPIAPAVRQMPLPSSEVVSRETIKNVNSTKSVEVAALKAPEDSTQLKSIFEEMLVELKKIQNEKNDLINQLAETNRSVMQLQFQVDSHSESFRPMPTREERDDRSNIDDTFPGVLPPRANPVYPLDQ